MSDEGELALTIVSRLLIELTVNEHLPKQVALEILEDAEEALRQKGRHHGAALARSLSLEIEGGVRDDPD